MNRCWSSSNEKKMKKRVPHLAAIIVGNDGQV